MRWMKKQLCRLRHGLDDMRFEINLMRLTHMRVVCSKCGCVRLVVDAS